MDRITDAMYIGDIRDASDSRRLRRGSPTAVLKLTPGEPDQPYPDGLAVRDVPLIDGPQNDYDDFERATETLLELLAADHVVLVHCSAGISRSASVVAAALATTRELSLGAAIEFVRERRPPVAPHSALREQAQRFVETH